MILVIVQGLLNAIAAYLAIHLTVHPVDKKASKVKIRLPKIIIVVCCVGSIVLSAFQFRDSQRSEEKLARGFGEQLDELRTNFDQSLQKSTKVLNEKIGDANSLHQRLENTLDMVLTNTAISASARQSIEGR